MSDFQLDLYVHLINWKWQHLTREPGYFRGNPYDALLPSDLKAKLLPIHPSVSERFLAHKQRFPFKTHQFIGHMASSQAACANLFLPLLQYPSRAAQVLQAVKPDLHRIAVEWFDSGFRLEFWDEPDNALNDHNPASGTDSDIAIAYYTEEGELNLWLIEHKLTEDEFTTCGGYRSRGRNKQAHRCDSIADILNDRRLCYYDSALGYKYWEITQANPTTFPTSNLLKHKECPFRGGLNQLWRNQLLALAIENSTSQRWPFECVYLSVVHHPKNQALNSTMTRFKELTGNSDRFSSFGSDAIVSRADELGFAPLRDWVTWFRELYYY